MNLQGAARTSPDEGPPPAPSSPEEQAALTRRRVGAMATAAHSPPHPRPQALPSQGREEFWLPFQCQTLEPLERGPLDGK